MPVAAGCRLAPPDALTPGSAPLAGEPPQEGANPPGKGERTIGLGTCDVGEGDVEQLGVDDRSRGARGEARFGVGQRISVGWAGAAR